MVPALGPVTGLGDVGKRLGRVTSLMDLGG